MLSAAALCDGSIGRAGECPAPLPFGNASQPLAQLVVAIQRWFAPEAAWRDNQQSGATLGCMTREIKTCKSNKNKIDKLESNQRNRGSRKLGGIRMR
jgi:hypothetical protein